MGGCNMTGALFTICQLSGNWTQQPKCDCGSSSMPDFNLTGFSVEEISTLTPMSTKKIRVPGSDSAFTVMNPATPSHSDVTSFSSKVTTRSPNVFPTTTPMAFPAGEISTPTPVSTEETKAPETETAKMITKADFIPFTKEIPTSTARTLTDQPLNSISDRFSLTPTSAADAGMPHQSSTPSMLLATASSPQSETSTQTPRIFPASDQAPRDKFYVIGDANEQRKAGLERTETQIMSEILIQLVSQSMMQKTLLVAMLALMAALILGQVLAFAYLLYRARHLLECR